MWRKSWEGKMKNINGEERSIYGWRQWKFGAEWVMGNGSYELGNYQQSALSTSDALGGMGIYQKIASTYVRFFLCIICPKAIIIRLIFSYSTSEIWNLLVLFVLKYSKFDTEINKYYYYYLKKKPLFQANPQPKLTGASNQVAVFRENSGFTHIFTPCAMEKIKIKPKMPMYLFISH